VDAPSKPSADPHRELVYRPLQFDERSQYFIGAHDETLSVAMRVHNPDCSSLGIQSRHPTQTPAGLAQIISDDVPILHGGWILAGRFSTRQSQNDMNGSAMNVSMPLTPLSNVTMTTKFLFEYVFVQLGLYVGLP
jgi:hypothetical protein